MTHKLKFRVKTDKLYVQKRDYENSITHILAGRQLQCLQIILSEQLVEPLSVHANDWDITQWLQD
jgi:hypothetical protein